MSVKLHAIVTIGGFATREFPFFSGGRDVARQKKRQADPRVRIGLTKRGKMGRRQSPLCRSAPRSSSSPQKLRTHKTRSHFEGRQVDFSPTRPSTEISKIRRASRNKRTWVSHVLSTSTSGLRPCVCKADITSAIVPMHAAYFFFSALLTPNLAHLIYTTVLTAYDCEVAMNIRVPSCVQGWGMVYGRALRGIR